VDNFVTGGGQKGDKPLERVDLLEVRMVTNGRGMANHQWLREGNQRQVIVDKWQLQADEHAIWSAGNWRAGMLKWLGIKKPEKKLGQAVTK
jgi:hypothetical protein